MWNTKDGTDADTATEVAIHLFERRTGETAWTQNRDTTLGRWIEIRAVGVSGTASAWTTDWTPVGQGRPFLLPPIPTNSCRQLEMRDNTPGSAGTDSIELRLSYTLQGPSLPVGIGAHLGGLRGVVSGIGDGLYSALIRGGALTPSGSPDDQVHIDDLEWIWTGESFVRLAAPITLNGTSASGALISGEAYWATLSVGGSGVTTTKSDSGTAPLATDLRPAVPAGELLLGYVQVGFAGTIGSSDIYDSRVIGRFALAGTGLTRRIGPGVALLDDRVITWDTPRLLTLPASTSAIGIYLLPVGTPAFSATGKPDPRAALLYRVETDGSDISASTDVRPILRTRPGMMSFPFDAVLVVNAAVILTFPGEADGVLCVGRSCVAILFDLGVSPTAGATVFEVEYWSGAAWTSLFTSSGTVDRRPAIPYNAPIPYASEGKPEVIKIPKGLKLRARVAVIPTATTAPSGAELQLFYEVPG